MSYLLTARFPDVPDSQTPNFFAAVCHERFFPYLLLPPLPACLLAWLSIYLPCRHEQLHVTTTATMGKRKPSDAGVEEVPAKTTKKSRVTMHAGMFLDPFFSFYRSQGFIEWRRLAGWQGWLMPDLVGCSESSTPDPTKLSCHRNTQRRASRP